MSFSPSLQSKIARIWNSATITGVTNGGAVTSWTDSIIGDTATTNGQGPGLTLQTNAFGTMPGIVSVQSFPASALNLTSNVSTYALFALATADTTTVLTQALGGLSDFVRGSDDISNGIEARDNQQSTLQCYENGVAVGMALSRRNVPSVFGIVSPSPLNVSSIGGAYVGANPPNTYFTAWCGTIGAIVLLNAVPSSSDIEEITAYLTALGPITPAPTPKRMTLFFGDSLTSDDGGGSMPADDNSTYPGLVARYRGLSNQTWQNFGWFGCTTANVLTVAQNQGGTAIADAAAAGYTDITCVLLIGRNDIYNGASAATASANVRSILTTLRTARATRILLCTIFASDGGANQTVYDSARATYNAALIGMVPTLADDIVRLDLDPYLGPNGSQANGTYFTPDQIHLEPPGIERQAANVEAVITLISATAPSSSGAGVASGNGSIIANIQFNGSQTITITSNNASDVISPSIGEPGTGTVIVTPTSGSASFTYTITSPTAGTSIITFTNGQGWNNPSSVTFTTSSISLSPSSVFTYQPATILVTGDNTNFSGTPFTLIGGSGSSIISQIVTDSTHATLVINPGDSTGTLIITDSSEGVSATLTAGLYVPAPIAIQVYTLPHSAEIVWTPPADQSHQIVGYQLFRNSILIYYGPESTYTDSSLTVGTTYIYSVLAYDNENNRSADISAIAETIGVQMLADQNQNEPPTVSIAGVDLGPVVATDQSVYHHIYAPSINGPVVVTLGTTFSNSELRYTLNGKNPTPTSPLYTKPLTFIQNATGDKTAIKVRAYDKTNAGRKSKIIRAEFRVIPEN